MSAETFNRQDVTLPLPFRRSQPEELFVQLDYAGMIGQLEAYYRRLSTMLRTPAVMRYEDLVALRRRVLQPEPGFVARNLLQDQLNLALSLFRLGRRSEGYAFLKDAEERLLEWENPARSACYLVWIALVRAALGDRKDAFCLSLQIVSQGTDPELGTRLVTFFKSLRQQSRAFVTL